MFGYIVILFLAIAKKRCLSETVSDENYDKTMSRDTTDCERLAGLVNAEYAQLQVYSQLHDLEHELKNMDLRKCRWRIVSYDPDEK
jgi:hypothetical protein